MTVKIFCHTQVEKGTRAYPKLVMKNRTKIKACFLLTTSYRLSAQHLKDGVLSRRWWLRTPKLTEYMDLLYEWLRTLDAVSPTVHAIRWCNELKTAPKKLPPNLGKPDVPVLFQAEYAWSSTSYFFQSFFRQDWKAGWKKALSIECYARISWDLPISLRSRQTRGPSGGQKSTATVTVDAERVREIVEFWREKKHKDLLAKDASLALQYFIEDFSWDIPSQLSLILVPACAKDCGTWGHAAANFKAKQGYDWFCTVCRDDKGRASKTTACSTENSEISDLRFTCRQKGWHELAFTHWHALTVTCVGSFVAFDQS